MKEHRIKIIPAYFADVKKGIKNFELRKFDRAYQVGDMLILEEWRPDGMFSGEYTGNVLCKKIQYVLADCAQYGLKDEYCILGFAGNLNLE